MSLTDHQRLLLSLLTGRDFVLTSELLEKLYGFHGSGSASVPGAHYEPGSISNYSSAHAGLSRSLRRLERGGHVELFRVGRFRAARLVADRATAVERPSTVSASGVGT